MAQTIDSGHAIAVWSEARVYRSVAEAAFAAVGTGNLVPKADRFKALTRAVGEIVSTCRVADAWPAAVDALA